MTTLQVGDYAYGKVGIERKSEDFTNLEKMSIQIKELKANYGDRAYLVVSANLDDLIKVSKMVRHKDMTKSILGIVASLAVRYNVPPIFCSNDDYAAYIMKALMVKGNDNKVNTAIKAIRPNETKGDRQIHIICGLPGVSEVMAERLLKEFGTVQNVMNADTKALIKVKGISNKKADKIAEVLR